MAAFKGTLDTMLPSGAAGPSLRFSASDVAAAAVTWDDLPGTPSFFMGKGYRLADLTVSAVGGAVVALQFRRGTADTDKIIRIGKLLETLAGMDGKSRLGQLYGARLDANVEYALIQR